MIPNFIHDGKLDRVAAAEALQKFLDDSVRAAGLDLKVNVRAVAPETAGLEGHAEVIADLDGRDKEILLERNAEVLKAIEHPAFHERIDVDCAGYRALRFEELRMTAKVAAERVEASRQPFRLNPMSSRERRIVHLALKDIPGVRTESIGMGEERQVVIHPADKSSKAPA